MTHIASRTVGILAGMGPAAGADFARLFVLACEDWLRAHGHAVVDQAYPAHWMAQLPIADRTRALADPQAPQPLAALAQGLAQLAGLGARAVAMPCNTAHAWHAALQRQVPQVELLHMPQETAAELRRRGLDRVALLATEGSYRIGLYEQAFAAQGIACVLPGEAARQWLMEGIYGGVKAGDLVLAQQRFVQAGAQLRAQHGDIALAMACTEIPLALPQAPEAQGWTLVDPTAILAASLARRAYADS
ncbi:amino acid racemase [Melaminivora sp.]|uniref:aspartate/glutamate racemase family protein n=1 Tax=Melaminivora sp. TaxID=1933032 RepID=UPI0028A60BA9|nr:amino acid racemase [Melaminivora sp.]